MASRNATFADLMAINLKKRMILAWAGSKINLEIKTTFFFFTVWPKL